MISARVQMSNATKPKLNPLWRTAFVDQQTNGQSLLIY